MSFGSASKYVILSGDKICHLVGRRNMSFVLASKYVIWSGVEICHFDTRQQGRGRGQRAMVTGDERGRWATGKGKGNSEAAMEGESPSVK